MHVSPPSNDTFGAHYLADWYGQPRSLIRSAEALQDQWEAIQSTAGWLRRRSPLLLTGMGSSYNAVLALESLLLGAGINARAVDASELLYSQSIPAAAGVIVASRSGESVEIVKLLEKCGAQNVPVVAVTNAPQSILATRAQSVIHLQSEFDHLVSLRMYTAIVQGLLILGTALCDAQARFPLQSLTTTWRSVAERMDSWRSAIHESGFFGAGCVYYCLGRGASWASANEARIKLEEGGKTNATALLTGAFRHGPQEVLSSRFRGIMWLPTDPTLRAYDLALAQSIAATGARCLLIGAHLAQNECPDLCIELPSVPSPFQPIIDVVPMQIGVYEHALATGKDPDEFAYCSYVVTAEGGGLGEIRG